MNTSSLLLFFYQLEQTQRELSRLQQLNRNLQDELQREKEIHSRDCFGAQV